MTGVQTCALPISLDELQKLTDRYIAEIDRLIVGKEAEIMAV